MESLKYTYKRLLVGLLALTYSFIGGCVYAEDPESAEEYIYTEANKKGEAIGEEGRKAGKEMPAGIWSLLTCWQSEEIYGLYGHTALRWRNVESGEDLVFNYGIFNFRKPFFALRFTMGKTDYELGVTDYGVFRRAYRERGVRVREQVLDLSEEESERLLRAILINYLPENRVYRYNCYYDNCTTRARDKIEECVGGRIVYPDSIYERATFRTLIHGSNKGHPWAAFGVDMCMGLGSDLSIERRKQQFLPRVLMDDFDGAQIEERDGSRRPLVRRSKIVVDPGERVIEKEFPLSPTECGIVLLALCLIIGILELRKGRLVWGLDILLMTGQTLAGIIIVALFLSEHPTTSTNLQILILNPLPLFMIPSIVKEGRKKKKASVYWRIMAVMSVCFLLGSIVQDYAEGMEFVGICILTRCITHIIINKRRWQVRD